MSGIIETEAVRAGLGEGRSAFVTITPLGRVSRAAEVANAAVLFASDESSVVNGAVLTVDGGTLAARPDLRHSPAPVMPI